MKKLFVPFLFICGGLSAQPFANFEVGATSTWSLYAGAGVSGRIGGDENSPSVFYAAGLRYYAVQEYATPAAIAYPAIGIAWSWNNGRGHELTTALYGKVDVVLAANQQYKDMPSKIYGGGIRHHFRNFYADVSYSQKMVHLSYGWCFSRVYSPMYK
jgi:hypothetical protein